MSSEASSAAEELKPQVHGAAAAPASSTVVDIARDLSTDKTKTSWGFWSNLLNAAAGVEEHLAEWFGLNQSKYQWAVDEFMDKQLSGEPQLGSTLSKALTEQQMEPTSQQIMHRDRNRLADV